MKWRDLLGDLIGVLCIFGMTWGALVIAHALN